MRTGQVSQTVYRRSIQKKLHIDRKKALFVPSQAEMCCGITPSQGESVVHCQSTVWGNAVELPVFAAARGANALASRGAEIKGISLQFLLPESTEEEHLSRMMEQASAAADREGFELFGAEALVLPGMEVPAVCVNAVGTAIDIGIQSRFAQPGQELVLLKWIGLEGMIRTKREREQELAAYFAPSFLYQMERYQEDLFSVRETLTAAAMGVSAIHPVGEGGIFAALWNLAETAGIGMTVDMRKLSVKQETIEVCELFHLNPYQLASTGAMLVVAPKGEEMADALKKEGVCAEVIGRTHKGKDRVILQGDEKRYMDRPSPDAFTRLFE